MPGADTHGREARGKLGIGSFAPGDPMPSFFRKVERQLLGRDRLMLGVATERARRTATPAPLLRRQRFHARRPQAGRGLDADGVGKTDLGDPGAETGVVAVSLQPISERQAGVIVGRRKAHRDLTVVLLAELTAVLPRYAH